MRTHRTKEEYINNLNTRIEMRNRLLKAFNEVVKPTIQEFNGKVLNKRFWDALFERLQAVDPCLWVKQDIHIKNCFEVHLRKRKFDYGDYEDLRVMLITNEDKRIDAEAGQTDQERILTAFDNDTQKHHDAVNNYDTYFAVAQALESAVNAYNKLPYTFRENINKSFLYIN